MEKRVVKIWDLQSSGATAALLILSAAFLLGGVAGCLLAAQVGGSSEALGSYLEGYLSMALSGETIRPEIFSLIWETIRWPLFTFILGLTPLGLLGVPIVFLVRGFLLSFAIASFFHVMGAMGLAVAFVVFGVTGLLGIPVLFVLGVQGFLSSGAMAGRLLGEGGHSALLDRAVLLRCGLCAAALCVCGLLEYCVVPALLESLAGFWAGV